MHWIIIWIGITQLGNRSTPYPIGKRSTSLLNWAMIYTITASGSGQHHYWIGRRSTVLLNWEMVYINTSRTACTGLGSSDGHTGGYQTRVPSIPEGTGSHKLVSDGCERTGVHGHRQRTPATMAVGNWEKRRTVVCVRWLDSAERSESIPNPTAT